MARPAAAASRRWTGANPPRYAIPLWIEGEKFFFWALVYGLALIYPFSRRAARPFRTALYVGLVAYLAGVVFFAKPFTAPLAQFRGELAPWFAAGADVEFKVRLFFKIYPRMIYYYNAPYMWVHPPMLFAAYALLTVTFAACVFMLFSARREQEREAYFYAKLGYLLLTRRDADRLPVGAAGLGAELVVGPEDRRLDHDVAALHGVPAHAALRAPAAGLVPARRRSGILCYLSLIFTYFMSWYFPGEHTFQ